MTAITTKCANVTAKSEYHLFFNVLYFKEVVLSFKLHCLLTFSVYVRGYVIGNGWLVS